MQISTWLTIAIGLMTTIMVSLSSTDFGKGNERAAPTIRILAIILPAVGTATAAIIAFYGLSAEMARASHTVASLRQVHSQMALDLWSLAPVPAASNDPLLEAKLQEWVKRYNDIKAVAEAAAPSKPVADAAAPSKDEQISPSSGGATAASTTNPT